MQKTVLKYSLILGLLMISLACVASNVSSVSNVSTPDPNAISTAIAGTMAAARTRTAQAELLAITPTLTTTPTRIASATPFPTYTLAVVAPQVVVSVNTNCRAGPGKQYAIVGGLLKGEFARVVGRSKDGKYWIIANPDRPGKVCWLWGGDATVTGIVGMVPVYTPPPTPKPTSTSKPQPTRTPAPPLVRFAAKYKTVERCPGTEWWIDAQVKNTGEVTLRSVAVILQDIDSGMTFYGDSEDFINRDNCVDSSIKHDLDAGESTTISLPPLGYSPRGHEMYAFISLCTRRAQGGKCWIEIIHFTP